MDSCPTTWWANFLYITNFYRPDDQCYVSSWYLSTDFQIYCAAPILLICFSWRPRAGYILAGTMIVASFIIHVGTVMYYHFPATDLLPVLVPKDPKMVVPHEKYTKLIYEAPWIRCPPYIIGIIVGYFMQTTQKIKMSKFTSSLLFLLSFVTMFGIIHGIYYDHKGHLISVVWRALYSALSKPLWAICISWIVYGCYHGYGGFINDFLSMKIFQPLGRLSYSVYLLHMSMLFVRESLKGSRYVFTGMTSFILIDVIPLCIVTFITAIILSAVLEIGTGKLEEKLLGMDKRRKIETKTRE